MPLGVRERPGSRQVLPDRQCYELAPGKFYLTAQCYELARECCKASEVLVGKSSRGRECYELACECYKLTGDWTLPFAPWCEGASRPVWVPASNRLDAPVAPWCEGVRYQKLWYASAVVLNSYYKKLKNLDHTITFGIPQLLVYRTGGLCGPARIPSFRAIGRVLKKLQPFKVFENLHRNS